MKVFLSKHIALKVVYNCYRTAIYTVCRHIRASFRPDICIGSSFKLNPWFEVFILIFSASYMKLVCGFVVCCFLERNLTITFDFWSLGNSFIRGPLYFAVYMCSSTLIRNCTFRGDDCCRDCTQENYLVLVQTYSQDENGILQVLAMIFIGLFIQYIVYLSQRSQSCLSS